MYEWWSREFSQRTTQRRKRRETDRENCRSGWNPSQKVWLKEHQVPRLTQYPQLRRHRFTHLYCHQKKPSSNVASISCSLTSRKTRIGRFAGKRRLREHHAKETQNTEGIDFKERKSLETSLQLTKISLKTRSMDIQWSFKILSHNGFEAVHAKVKVPKKPCRACDGFCILNKILLLYTRMTLQIVRGRR